MTKDKEFRRNSEGYSDPTAYAVLKKEDAERFHKLIHTISYICEIADFKIEERIILKDNKTGKVWR